MHQTYFSAELFAEHADLKIIPNLHPHPQRRLIPKRILLLIHPIPAFLVQLKVKMPQNTTQDRPDFEIG
jgi:hypothetical protein